MSRLCGAGGYSYITSVSEDAWARFRLQANNFLMMGVKMLTMNKESALNWLWGTSIINLGLGAILWGWNTAALSIVNFDRSGEQMNAVVWQGIGSGFLGFGVLVFVITLATSAVVGAIEENLKSLVRNGNSNPAGDREPGEARIPESKAKGNNNQPIKSTVNWLMQEEK